MIVGVAAETDPISALRHQVIAEGVRTHPDCHGLSDTVFETLAAEIVEGALQPGEELNSVALALRFRTSRTPIREALLRLGAENLVAIPPRRRPVVAKPSIGQVREIYELRAELHGFVSELVIERASDEEVGELFQWQQLREDDARRCDSRAYFWHNVAARNAEVRLARNSELERVLHSLRLQTLQLRHMSLSLPNRAQKSAEKHRHLIEAYMRRDRVEAKRTTQAIVSDGYEAIAGFLDHGADTVRSNGGKTSRENIYLGKGSKP